MLAADVVKIETIIRRGTALSSLKPTGTGTATARKRHPITRINNAKQSMTEQLEFRSPLIWP
jgi:hypothetical protein